MTGISNGEETEQNYTVPTAAILQAGLADTIFHTKLESIQGGIRFFEPARGYVIDYFRAGEDTWNVQLWDILKKPYPSLDGNEESLKLVTAVLFADDPSLQPDYCTTTTIDISQIQMTGTPADLMFYALDAKEHEISREYKYQNLIALAPELVITNAGGACPFQMEGTLNGHDFYFRYRGGYASLKIGLTDAIGEPYWSAGTEYGHYLDGDLNQDEVAYLFCLLATQLDKTPYRYIFYRTETGPEAVIEYEREDGTTFTLPDEYIGWGLTAEEARLDTCERNREMKERFGDDYRQVSISPDDITTDTVDPRVYPAVTPVFTILRVPDATIPRSLPEDET